MSHMTSGGCEGGHRPCEREASPPSTSGNAARERGYLFCFPIFVQGLRRGKRHGTLLDPTENLVGGR